MMKPAVIVRAAPYSRLARGYDAALGLDHFARTRRTFARLIRRHGIRFRSAVDVGCGTGLFARYLACRWGARVFAVDRSRDMLRQAAHRTRDERVVLLRQDVRRLTLPHQVDLATANFDTLNHLLGAHDLACAFRRIGRAVRPGGHFIFDVVTPCDPLGGRRGVVNAVRCRGAWMIQRIGWDPHQHLMRIQVLVRRPGSRAVSVEEHLERAWLPGHIRRELDEAGFDVDGLYDARTLRASGCAPRLVFVARRREQP